MFARINSAAASCAASFAAPASAVTIATDSTARTSFGTSRAASRAGMWMNVKIARRTCSAKAASVSSSPFRTSSRVKAGDTFKMAPTRSTGSPSNARAGRFSNCPTSDNPMRRTVSGSTLPVIDTAKATRRARSPGSLPNNSAAFGTGSFDSITAATSTLSSIRIGSNLSASSAMILSHGSALAEAPASLRSLLAAVVLIWPSIMVSAPSMPPGNDRPTCSNSPMNSATTAPRVVRSTSRI